MIDPTSLTTRAPTILNVDDVPAALAFKTLTLRQVGFHVIECSTGMTTWALIANAPPDLLLLDINLPDIDGFQIVRRIRENRALDWLPIVHITQAERSDAEWLRGLSAGADAYLAGPIDPDVIVEVVRALLRRTAAERKHMEEREETLAALHRSDIRHRQLIDEAPYGIIRSTTAGQILAANAAMVRILGYESADALLRTGKIAALYRDPSVYDGILRTLRTHGRVENMELEWNRADGSSAILCFAMRSLADGSELESFVEDITEHKRLENELRQSQKMEAVGRLAGGIAHDFNNMLTAIIGYSELILEETGTGTPLHGDLIEIKKAADRAATLTRQLLAFSRRLVLHLAPLSLNTLVSSLLPMLQRTLGEDVTLDTDLAADLETMVGDAGQIDQILMNLSLNARDAMPAGGRISIATANVDIDEPYAQRHFPMQPGRYVQLTVTDTGTGMSAEVRALVFEPFFTTKDVGKGTGLGLATVYGIVKQMNGFVWVESEPGQGAAFRIFFPSAGRIDAVPPPAAHTPQAAAAGHEVVLLVEDDPAVRTLARSVLQRNGYRVLEAASGDEALRIAAATSNRIELLITDVVMPGMAGVQLAARLHEIDNSIRILFISGYSELRSSDRGTGDQHMDLLEKPFTPRALLARVRARLDA